MTSKSEHDDRDGPWHGEPGYEPDPAFYLKSERKPVDTRKPIENASCVEIDVDGSCVCEHRSKNYVEFTECGGCGTDKIDMYWCNLLNIECTSDDADFGIFFCLRCPQRSPAISYE